jgi:ATP-dependent RNA helicase DDX54/DBP10
MFELCTRAGFKGALIYGSMDQRAREEKLSMFRKKFVSFLFVTDLAARGLDIPLLENVIHYDFPTKMKLFIHRSGRTARAGQKGTSYCLITQEELAYMHDLSHFVGRKVFDNLDEHPDLMVNPDKICYGRLP